MNKNLASTEEIESIKLSIENKMLIKVSELIKNRGIEAGNPLAAILVFDIIDNVSKIFKDSLINQSDIMMLISNEQIINLIDEAKKKVIQKFIKLPETIKDRYKEIIEYFYIFSDDIEVEEFGHVLSINFDNKGFILKEINSKIKIEFSIFSSQDVFSFNCEYDKNTNMKIIIDDINNRIIKLSNEVQ